MDTYPSAVLLNELLIGEQQSLATRLMESTVFVSRLSSANESIVHRMARTSRENQARLVGLILGIGGAPGPRPVDTLTATLHFQDLEHVMPQLLVNQEKLMHLYDAVAPRLGLAPKVANLIGQIQVKHRDHLKELKKHCRSLTSKAS